MREPTRFYRCVDLSGTGKHYRRYQFSCPAGTAFDEGLSICNFLHAVLPCANQAKKAVISQVMPGLATNSIFFCFLFVKNP